MPASGGSASDTNAPTNKVVDGQSHHLAYITPNEADKLVALGGKETMTDEGIPAYPPTDNWGGEWVQIQNLIGVNQMIMNLIFRM